MHAFAPVEVTEKHFGIFRCSCGVEKEQRKFRHPRYRKVGEGAWQSKAPKHPKGKG